MTNTQLAIYLGCGLFILGVILIMISTRLSFGIFTRYRSTNKGMTALGTLILIVGLVIIIGAAYLNGQLG